jgi:hypothetical protein
MADNKDDKTAQTNEAQSVENQKQKLTLQRQSAQERLEEIEVLKEQLKLNKNSLDNDKQYLELQLETLKIKRQLGQITKEELEQQREITKDVLKRKSLEADLSNELSGQVKSFIGIGGNSTSLLGKMVSISKEGGNVSLAFADAAKNIAMSITPTNLLAAAVDKVVANTKKLFFDMDKSFSEFEKKAGGVDAFKGRIDSLRRSNVEYGVSIEDAGKAFSDLKTQFAGFAGVSATTQNALADTTAKMEKLGVSSSETIKIQNMLVKGFQMTGEQAGQTQKQLMATAKAMGLPMQQVVKEFANASNGLRANGANMQKVFIDLQNQSKNLGIEFGRLQDITGKFDTFEGAADAAGKLNAILGGDYLNSIQLLNADEAERVRILQDSLKASGQSFEAMSKQERMAAAQAIGIDDVTELQKLMNNSVQEGTVEALNKAQADKELKKSAENLGTMQEKLNNIMGQFAVALIPVLDAIKPVLTQIAEFISKNPVLIEGIAKAVLAFGTLYVAIKSAKAFAAMKTAVTEAGGVIPAYIKSLTQKTVAEQAAAGASKAAADAQNEAAKSGDGGKKLGDTIKSIGDAAKGAWKEILAFGAAMLMIGGGIALAALGLAELVKAFQGLTGPQILGALGALIIVMGGFAIMLAILAKIGTVAAIPLLAVGAAFLMIGGGIAIAALGLAQLVKSFSGLGDAAMPAAIAVAAFSVSMYLVVSSLAASIPVVIGAGAAFTAAAPGLLAFGAAIALVGVGVGVAAAGIGFLAKSVGDMFEKISKSKPETIAGSFAALFDSLSLTNIGKFTAFASQTDNLTSSLTKLALSLTSVAAGMKAVAAIETLFTPSVATAPTTKPTATPAATAPAATASSANSNIVPVAIYIDSKKVGELLDPRYKKMIEDSLNNIGARTVPI